MLKHKRRLLLPLVIAANALSAALLAGSDTSYRVDLSSVVELWGDVVKGVDKFGLTVTTISVEKEIALGDEIAAQGFPPLPDRSLQLYVDEVGSKIAENVRRKRIPYRFHLIDSAEVNAYAVAGGHVYITSGMLGHIQSEAELAYIFGHEIAHVDLKHSVGLLQYELFLKRVAGGTIGKIAGLAHDLVRLGYSEQQELEADRTGLLLMARAGYFPLDGLEINARLHSVLEPEIAAPAKPKLITQELGRATGKAAREYFATHPSFADRLGHLEDLANANAGAWKGKEFCVGRSNFRLHLPCFVFKPPGESAAFEPQSDVYYLKLGFLADHLGDEVRAKRYLLRALAIKPAIAEEHWLRASQLIARGELEPAIGEIELAERLWLFERQEFGKDRRPELREAFVAHVEVLRKLGRADFPLLPAALGYPAFDNPQLCRLMLEPPGEKFDNREALKDAGAETVRRSLSVNDCRGELGLPKLPATRFVDDRRICRSALDHVRSEWESSASWKEFVDEAQRRQLSVRDCRVALGLPRADNKPFAGFSNEDLCSYVLNADSRGSAESGEAAAREAGRRNLSVEACRAALGTSRSIADHDEAIRLNPKDADAFYNRGLAHGKQGDLVRAIAHFDEAIRLNPQHADAFNNRGVAHEKRGDLVRAIADYDEAIRLNPQHADAFNNRGFAHGKQGDLVRAIADYDEAIRLNPQHADAFSNRGLAHAGRGDLARAIADYDEAIRLNPQHADAFNNRCWARAQSGIDLAAARADCDQALTLSNNEPNHLDSRGLVGIKQEKYAEAWADYDAASRTKPGTAHFLYGRGIAALRLGRTEEGKADLAQATQLDANIAQTYAGYGVTP